MSVSLDPLRYGLRALEEMARSVASVPAPSPMEGAMMATETTVTTRHREGAAMSLRMFSEASDDATDFVLRDDASWTMPQLPARALSLFEAHTASLVLRDEATAMVGFPLVTFLLEGQRRTAPLFYIADLELAWSHEGRPWSPPANAWLGSALATPTSLTLRTLPQSEEGPSHALHAGLWRTLFGVDGDELEQLSEEGETSIAAMVRSATRRLGGEVDATRMGDLTRDDLLALVRVVTGRASSRLALNAHLAGLVMLLPKGDPTSALRGELKELLRQRPPRSGPLAVYLGAKPARTVPTTLVAHGERAPTPSQREAAEALASTRDLVALCGPPGCGKTTLLHHLAAEAIVDLALGETWRRPPLRRPWALAVTSTNNAAVDHALAPFVRDLDFPVGLRVGNRWTRLDVTAALLQRTLDALVRDEGPSLQEATRAFDAQARAWRTYLTAREKAQGHRRRLEADHEALTVRLASMPAVMDDHGLTRQKLQAALDTLRAHRRAADLVVTQYVQKKNASRLTGRSKWNDGNARRSPAVRPVLETLGWALPFADVLEDEALAAAMDTQREAMTETVTRLETLIASVDAAPLRARLASLDVELAELREADDAPPLPDPSLVPLALAVREAWARAHRKTLVPLLTELHALMTEQHKARVGASVLDLLGHLAALFPLVGCTLLSFRSAFPLTANCIDRLVIDEAGQCAPVYAIAALHRATRALVTGDTAQLPPVYTLPERLDAHLAADLDADTIAPFRMGAEALTSAQAVAELRALDPRSLVEHFRSQPAIVALASQWSGHTLTVETPLRSLAHVSRRLDRPVRVEHVGGEGARWPEGVVNELEARRVVRWVEALLQDGVDPNDIAVLSPFVGQTVFIERHLAGRGVLVRTVHKLQGGERRVVIFSLTATSPQNLRWLCARPHLLHVATSRAQDHLIVLLNAITARREESLRPLLDLL